LKSERRKTVSKPFDDVFGCLFVNKMTSSNESEITPVKDMDEAAARLRSSRASCHDEVKEIKIKIT